MTAALAAYLLQPSVSFLNEGAFVDNQKDIKDWDEDAELKKLGIAYAEGAAEYLKLPKKTAAPAQEKVLYRVQVGAYEVKENAQAMVEFLQKVGVAGFIVEVKG